MIRSIIIPWVGVAELGFIVGGVIGIEFDVVYIVHDQTKIAINTTCIPKQLEKVWHSKIYLTMDCNGTEYWSGDEATIMAFGNERKIPACTLFNTGRAECVETPQG